LFYTPGVMHIAGPNFLDPSVLAAREIGETGADEAGAIHPDPRPAIYAFHDMLARRGIELVVFPVPDKAMLQPSELHGRGRTESKRAVARNGGWTAFVSELRERGVRVFDPAPSELVPGEASRFLVQDTHWTPAWMRDVAGQLARFLEREVGLGPGDNPRGLHAVEQEARRVGDLVDMLKLGEDQTTFQPESVRIAQVRDAHDAPWDANETADVLLLGDSFTNVFSDANMDWGEAAGLAPQLSLALGRDIDVIAQNDAGAHATRALLYRMLQSGQDRLHGKRVVIWEFASRELSVGDFKPLAWERLAATPEAR
jgi:alginate O-acetyltransferase complex protein AlgJ